MVSESYGLTLDRATFSEESGNTYELSFSNNKQKKSFNELPEDEKEKIKQILFIQDKFCIGDAAYHEVTMAAGGEEMPRSYLIKQCKESLNDLCHIERTPGSVEGAQLNFKQELCSTIRKHVSFFEFCFATIPEHITSFTTKFTVM